MADRKARDVKAKLADKFGFAPGPGDAHEFYVREVPSIGKVSTHFSLGERDLGEVLLKVIAGQLRVTGSYFKGMLDCKNSCDAWIQQIQDAPVGPLARFRRPNE